MAITELTGIRAVAEELGLNLDCDVCTFADVHGWWGPELAKSQATHCRVCHRSWTGTQQSHCVGCCEQFASPLALELHKDGTKCRPPTGCRTEEGEPVLEEQSTVWGPVWTRYGARIGVPAAGESAAG